MSGGADGSTVGGEHGGQYGTEPIVIGIVRIIFLENPLATFTMNCLMKKKKKKINVILIEKVI